MVCLIEHVADVSFACSSAAAELLLWQLGLCGRAAAEKRSWFCLCSFIFFLLLCPWLGRHDQGVLLLIRLRGLQPGLPRPQRHVYARPVMLVVNQEPSVQQCSAGDGLLGLGIVSRPSWMHACAVPLAPPQGSAKEAEEQGWRKWADRWLTELAPCLSSAPSLCCTRRFSSEILWSRSSKERQQGLCEGICLVGVVGAILRGAIAIRWSILSLFIKCVSWNLWQKLSKELHLAWPHCVLLQGFLGFDEWGTMLNSPVSVAWCKAGVHRRLRKEALPLPLCAVSAFEEAVLADFISWQFQF